jgi:hypothetical protein
MHLPNADDSRLVRGYREFLIRATASKWMDRLEGVLNYVCPKSIILYGEKRAVESNASQPTRASVSARTAAAA